MNDGISPNAIVLYGTASWCSIADNYIFDPNGWMQYQVGEVTEGPNTPANNTVGFNYGAKGTLGFVHVIGAGSSWIAGGGASWTPAVTYSGGGAPGSVTGWYKQVGRWIDFQITIAGGSGAGQCSFTLPANAIFTNVFAGRDGTSGKMVQGIVSSGSNVVAICNFDNSLPAAGDTLFLNGRYETSP